MGHVSRNVQKRAREYAKIMQVPYSQALADIHDTPTAVHDGVIWQPLRSMERNEAAVIVGPSRIINPLVESMRDQLAPDMSVQVLHLGDYRTESEVAEHVAIPVRSARSQAQIIAIIDNSPQLVEARAHAALAQFIPPAIMLGCVDLDSMPVERLHGRNRVSFRDGPLYVFDGYGDARNVTADTVTARDVIRNLKSRDVTILTKAEDAQEALFASADPERVLFYPTVYKVGVGADRVAVLTARFVARLGVNANMSVLCTDPDVAARIGVRGTIIRSQPDGTTSITIETPGSP